MLFGYFAAPSGDRHLRAVLNLEHPAPTRTLSRDSSRLKQYHPDDSLGNINENFYSLAYVEYLYINLEATRHKLIELIEQALSDETIVEHRLILERTLLVESRTEGGRRRRSRGQTLKQWLGNEGHSVDEYVNTILLGEDALNAVWGRRVIEGRRQGGGFPLWINVGDPIAGLAANDDAESSERRSYKLFLKFKAETEVVLNPMYFLNAVVKHRASIDFVGEEDIPENKLGVQTLLELPNPGSSESPPPSSRNIHPLIWTLSKGRLGVFQPAEEGRIALSDFPNLFVASAEAPLINPQLDHNFVNVEARGMDTFHAHIRYPVDHGRRTGERLSAGLYQWKINDRGYMVFRSNSRPIQEDDWYPFFSQSDLSTIRRIWQQSAEHINRLSLMYGLPCEIFVAVAGKESGGTNAAVALEPWIPPPDVAANEPPFPSRTQLVIVPSEELMSRYAHVRGIKYMLLTNTWTGGRWQPARKNVTFPGVAGIDTPISGGSDSYTWRELLQDLDHYGHTPAGASQPTESETDKRFLRTMDGRISPGLTQVLVREVPFQSGVRPEIVAHISEWDPNFFLQAGNPLHLGAPKDVLRRETPPSFRFLWLRDGTHTLFSSFNLIDSRVHNLIPYRRLGSSGYELGENNDPLDPLFAVTMYGGMKDLDRFVGEDSAFGFLAGANSRNNRRFHRFPPNYNACVYFFEASGQFGEGRMPPPSVRFLSPMREE